MSQLSLCPGSRLRRLNLLVQKGSGPSSEGGEGPQLQGTVPFSLQMAVPGGQWPGGGPWAGGAGGAAWGLAEP